MILGTGHGFCRALWIFSLLGLLGCQSKRDHTRPNILLIVADDLGWGDVGFNGQERIRTPNIDFLAKNGMVFNRMYAGSTVCGPSRASLITGMHTGHATVRGNPRWTLSGTPVDFDPAEVTVAEVLKQAGYKTGMIGKWGLSENLNGTQPNRQGFDYFYGFNKHLPAHHYYPEHVWENDSLVQIVQNNTQKKQGTHVQELFTKKALGFFDEQKGDAPFFLYLAYTTPHFELTIPAVHKRQYDTLGWPLRKMKPGHYLHDENGHVTYAAMVSKMDDDIGRLIQHLKENDQYENTLVIFTSDNGHEYDKLEAGFFDSNGPYRGRKRDLYDGGIHVPFVAFWPHHIKKGSTSDHLAAFWDIKATLGALAEAPLQEPSDGISFLPTLLDRDDQRSHEYLYWEFNEHKGPVQALLKGHWKLLHFVESGVFELYDLKTDPSEVANVREMYPELLDELKKTLATARTDHPEFPLTKRPRPWKK
ncbi:MAG: arylsulfatase [Flavobacteriaceae bacterium]